MQNGHITPNGEAMSIVALHAATLPAGSDQLLSLIDAFRAAADRFEAVPEPEFAAAEVVFEALRDRLVDKTPVCTSDAGAFAALSLLAVEMSECPDTDLTDALLAAVLDYARRRTLHS